MRVESNGNIDAVGDGGLAIGPFQIHNVYWLDAVAHDPSLRANGQTYQNCRGTGSIAYSKRVIQVTHRATAGPLKPALRMVMP